MENKTKYLSVVKLTFRDNNNISFQKLKDTESSDQGF